MSESNSSDSDGRLARLKLWLTALLVFIAFIGKSQTLAPEFVDAGYSILDVGSVPGVPTPYGGLTIRPEEPNTLYIGGAANNANGALYSIALIRDGETNQVTGFSGTATLVIATPDIDGGLVYAPNGTLLFTQFNQNGFGQILTDDTYITTILTQYGIASSVGSLVLVPPGYSGAGNLIIASYNGNIVYDVPYTISEDGEYLLSNQTAEVSLDGTAPGPEGIAYIPLGSDAFPNPSMVISSYLGDKVVAYDTDAIGLPIVSSAREMITDLDGAEGALIDPVTGDFMFSTFGTDNRVIVMSGFESPVDCAGVPFGESILDECGVCLLPDDPEFNASCADCAGVPNGSAFLDDCEDCVGGTTGEEPCDFDCPDLEANIGDDCDDGDESTENDMVDDACDCVGTSIWDCPDLNANIGDECDDGDALTENDEVDSDCTCSGTPIVIWDCPELEANIGDDCFVFDVEELPGIVNELCLCEPLLVWDCPDLEANIGDVCDDGDSGTENDMVNASCGCEGTPITVWDCPDLEANIGDDCDDGDESTENDEIGADCICTGTPILVWDCPDLEANIGDECDDGNGDTENDIVNASCGCEGTPILVWDCSDLEANIGDPCDDGDESTENDEVDSDCDCSGTPIIVWDCPDLEANIGDECDDGNDDLIPGIVNDDCECEAVFQVDCPELGLNVGDDCDDGNPLTIDDTVGIDCICSGTPIEPSDCDSWAMYINDNEGGESDIYSVDIIAGNAVLGYITTVDFHAHMAYNGDEHLLYVVNNTTGDYMIVDPASGIVSGPFILSDEIPSITTAVFAPNGKLLVGSATEDVIYSIDVSDNSVTVYDAYAPVSGGDIAFDSEGMLYLATRSGNGLYEVYPDDVWDDQYIGSVPSLVTGMALTESEQLLTSHNGNADLHLYNLDGSAAGTTYPLMLDGELFVHHNGDLASGCQEPDDLSIGDCEIFNTFYADINRPGVSGTDLYEVGFTDGGNAIMTFLTNVSFNGHIAYNAQDDIIYIVNQNASFFSAYDPTAGIFLGDMPIIGGFAGSVAVVYNPEDGLLYVGADSDDVYSIDPNTGVATYLFDAPVSGGDFAIQDGHLYLATRAGAKLYDIVGGVPVEIGSIPALVNGMAQANNSTDLIIANKNAGIFTKILAADGSTIGSYVPMIDGDAVTLYDGDMAAGCGDDEPLIIGACYATEIMEYVEGTNSGGGVISADRTDSSQALDEPERTDELVFVSLGYGGSLTVGFGGIVPNGPGDDIEVVETSYNNPGCESYPEYADVYVSVDGFDWHMAGNVCKGDPFVDISDAGDFDHIMYVMVVNTDGTTTSSDGFDIDGFVALHNCEEDGGEEGGDELVIVTESNNRLTSFPNPTSGHSQVVFITSATERTLVEVYDMNGRNVETLFNQVAQQGQEYRIDFDGSDLPNGVYVYRMTTNNETIIDKFMIAR